MEFTTDSQTGLRKTTPSTGTNPGAKPPIRPGFKWVRGSDGNQSWWNEFKLGWTGRGTSLHTSFGEVSSAAEFVAHKTRRMDELIAKAREMEHKYQKQQAEDQVKIEKDLDEIQRRISEIDQARSAGTITEKQSQREVKLYKQGEELMKRADEGNPRDIREIEQFALSLTEKMTQFQSEIDEVHQLEAERLAQIQAKATQVAQTAATAATNATAAGQVTEGQNQEVKATQAASVVAQATSQVDAMNAKIQALQAELANAKTQVGTISTVKPLPSQVTQVRAAQAAAEVIAQAPPAAQPALVKAAAEQIQAQAPAPPAPPEAEEEEEYYYEDEEEPVKPAIPTWGKILAALGAGLALKSKM